MLPHDRVRLVVFLLCPFLGIVRLTAAVCLNTTIYSDINFLHFHADLFEFPNFPKKEISATFRFKSVTFYARGFLPTLLFDRQCLVGVSAKVALAHGGEKTFWRIRSCCIELMRHTET